MMDLQICTLNSSTDLGSEIGQKLLELCRAADADPHEMARNIGAKDWENRPETLLYCLYREKRFDADQGKFFAILSSGHMVAVGGVYRSDFCPRVAVGGVRTYTHENHRKRFWHGEVLIPQQVQWAREQGMGQIIFSFNRSSLPLMQMLARAKDQKAGVLGLCFPDIYKKLEEYPKPILLKSTAQRILKLNLENDFYWDYSDLETEEV